MKWYSLFNPFVYLRKMEQIKMAIDNTRYSHYYDMAWDTCNSWLACNNDGWIFFDDICLEDKPLDWQSNGSRDALLALKQHGVSDIRFVYKRLSAKFSAHPRRRNLIGIIRKVL